MATKFSAVCNNWAPYGYSDFMERPDGSVVMLGPLLFTHGLFVGVQPLQYEYRYCYNSLCEARGALNDWADRGFQGEPEGYIVRKG